MSWGVEVFMNECLDQQDIYWNNYDGKDGLENEISQKFGIVGIYVVNEYVVWF